MPKTKTTPRGGVVKPVTTAAKHPDRTEKFLDDIDMALSDFDDEISSIDKETHKAAYETFVRAYQTAFTAIWPKIAGANVQTVLQSMKDKTLQEFQRMTHIQRS